MVKRRIAVTLTLSAMLVMALPAASLRASEGTLRQIGYLPRPSETTFGANGNILIDHRARRGYQATVADDTTITEINLDTLKPSGTLRLPRLQPAQTVAGPMDWVWALDSARRRLFAFRAESPDEDTSLENYSLIVADLQRRTVAPLRRLWPLADRVPLTISYHAPGDRLYLLTQVKSEIFGRSVFYLEERKPDGTLTWDRQIPACHGARDSQYAPTLFRSVIQKQFVYFNCYNQSNVQAQIIRVRIGSDGLPASEEAFPAVPGALSTMHDPGSDRFFFLTTNSGAGRGAWVFDGLRSSFLGVIASGDNRVGASDYAMGVDPVSGRLYMQTPAGFLVADARRTPLPSGLLFRAHAGFGVGLIQVDPVKRHVFVPDPETLSSVGRADRYVIYQDGINVSRDPARGDPDQFTLDVQERSGVTGSAYSGSARGYGVRVFQTGGIQKTAWNLAAGQFPPDDPSSPLFLNAWTTLGSAPVEPGNRELVAAQVRSVSLTTDSADVVVQALHSDDGTARDAAKNGVQWPFPVVECHDGGEAPAAANGTAGTSAATCRARDAVALGTAGSSQVPLKDVTVESAFSSASVMRDPRRGLVARSISVATGIEILGRVRIGTLRAEAETAARGRRNSATGRFERVFSDVRIDANADGAPEYACATTCEGRTVTTLINNALAGLASIEFPQPDPLYYPRGSKGGYQAVVEKERFRSYSERSLNDDETAEIPGLQLVVFNDGRAGRTRHLIQIAGVQAESHYGIYLLPEEGSESPPPEPPRPIITRPEPPEPAPSAGAPVPVPPRVRSVIDRVVKRVPAGAFIAMTKPARALALAALWSFLALPVYLTWRRRLVGVGSSGA